MLSRSKIPNRNYFLTTGSGLRISISKKFLLCAYLLLLVIPVLSAQDKQTIQIKTFDQKLQVLRNIDVAINNGEFVSVGNKGTVIVELNSSELPIKSIRIKDDKLEAASWNFSKGIVEIIVRQKSYALVKLTIQFPNGSPVANTSVSFKGVKAITLVTNQAGEIDLPLALNEKITSSDQFTVANHKVQSLNQSERGNFVIVEQPKVVQEKKQEPLSIKEQLIDFDLARLDSIKSLTVFYAVFKHIPRNTLTEDSKRRIDAKFNELIQHLQDSLKRRNSAFMTRISDSSFVTEDIKNLVSQASLESEALESNRTQFEEKIKVITAKLDKGLSNLSADSRANLIADLDFLEQMLIQNESKFYQNQNDYREIINSLKEKYFDIQVLEERLSTAERKREEEKQKFQQRMIGIIGVLILFAILIVLLISFSGRMRRQAKDLQLANEEIRTINENLEGIVIKRTQLLEESNKELDTFLYRASHDLRSPIRSILGLFNIIEHIPQAELIKRVQSTTLGMDHMIKKLINISEINQSSSVVVGPLNVSRAIHEAKNRQAKLIFDSRMQFNIDCPEDVVIQTKPALVDSILTNLIENAVFFSLLKDPDNALVEVKAVLRSDIIEITVYDNGVGIEEAIRPKLFTMFFSGHEKSHGNGLGLYTVQKCVHALSGKTFIESKPGSYTKVTVVLPLNKV